MKTLLQTLFFLLLINQISIAQWVQIGLSNKSIKDIEVKDSEIFAISADSGAVFYSVDNGVNWNKIVDSNAMDIEISHSGKLFLIKYDSLYTSSNISEDWVNTNLLEQIKGSLPSFPTPTFFFNPEKIFISSQGTIFCSFQYIGNPVCAYEGFALSTDDGLTWTTPGTSVLGGRLFAFKNQFVFTVGFASCMGGGGHHVYLSTDFGNTWDGANLPATKFAEFFSNGNIIAYGHNYDSGKNALIMSTDTCYSYIEIDTLNCQVGISLSNGSSEYLLVGTEGSGLFLYSDEGQKIGEINEGLINLNVQSLAFDNNGYVYTGSADGLWRRTVTEVTSVEENSTSLPSSYTLTQNFPNPFNPTTKIKYSIPQSSNVSIRVFDILGSEIEILVNEEKPVGTYEVNWNAVNLPSGVYFYQLSATGGAGDFIQTKKLILLK